MENEDDASKAITDEDTSNFLRNDLSAKLYVNTFDGYISSAIINEEPNKGPVTAENLTRAMITELSPETPTVPESKKEKTESISQLESSYYELQAKWEVAEAQRERDQAEINRLNNQIKSQTEFSLNVGAVMGNLVWRASYEPEVIISWFTKQSHQNKIDEFVSIADRIIGTFFNMYEEAVPPKNTDEYQFVSGLLGTLVNMAAIPEGRTFLSDNKNGKSLLRNLVYFLPKIPTPSGVPLKRSLIVVLWNMSVNKNVLCYLFELQIGKVVAHCIDESSPEQLRLLGFEFLLSITHNLTDPKCLDDIFKYVPIENIRRIADAERDKVGTLAHKFLDYIVNDEHIASRQNNHRWKKTL